MTRRGGRSRRGSKTTGIFSNQSQGSPDSGGIPDSMPCDVTKSGTPSSVNITRCAAAAPIHAAFVNAPTARYRIAYSVKWRCNVPRGMLWVCSHDG